MVGMLRDSVITGSRAAIMIMVMRRVRAALAPSLMAMGVPLVAVLFRQRHGLKREPLHTDRAARARRQYRSSGLIGQNRMQIRQDPLQQMRTRIDERRAEHVAGDAADCIQMDMGNALVHAATTGTT
ncbi:hypothetical protein CHELA1G11_20102 [Hyphomicrobiales bacterium]|nr:hypothetical protein CHELA1G11_20102 [Hyphomicrobiales bacterium]